MTRESLLLLFIIPEVSERVCPLSLNVWRRLIVSKLTFPVEYAKYF